MTDRQTFAEGAVIRAAHLEAVADMTREIQRLTAEIAAKDAEIARLRDALGELILACDRGRVVTKPGLGICGMTIDAQMRASCVNGVELLAVEEARAALYHAHNSPPRPE